MSEVRIAFALINYGPIWSPVYTSHLRAVAKASRTMTVEGIGGIFGLGASDRQYTHTAENNAVYGLLDTDCTHLFLCENDMILPDDCLVQLAALDKPIASGIYFLRGGHGQPCLYRRTLAIGPDSCGMTPVSIFPTDAPFELRGCPGLGCVLIRREVFEQLHAPWFDLKENAYGSDLYFYTNVVKAGIPVWVDPRVCCDQIEYTVWGKKDYEHRLATDPSFGANGYIIGAQR